jgi:hypothetical protein
MRTNQREIETFTTICPMSASPGLTSSQRKSRNCQKSLAWPRRRKPAPEIKPPAAMSHLPPCRSMIEPISGAAAAMIRISPERTSEKTPREIPRSCERGFRKTLSVLDIEKAEAMWARKPTATIVQP